MKHEQVFRSLQRFLEQCKADGKRFVICYVDRAGNTILLYRMPGAWLGSVEIARGKAYTAIAFSGPGEDEALTTEGLSELVQPGQPLYGIGDTNNGRLVVFGGGIPVYEDGKLVGAIGVSGSSVEDDVRYCELAVTAYTGTEPSGESDEE